MNMRGKFDFRGRTAFLCCLFVASFSAQPFLRAQAPSTQKVATIQLSKEVREAISEGLAFLAKTQNSNGSWGDKHPVADTSLALLAFMLQGHVPGRGDYGNTMDRGIAYIVKVGKEGNAGYLGTPSHHGGMYEHGLAILALSEAWGQSTNRDLRNTLKRAVDITIRAQNRHAQSKGGGWRYNPEPRDADLSMTVMHTVALNSAKEAGISVPDETLDRAINYVLYCQEETSGGFGYSGPSGPGFARTAAGVMSLLMCGVDANHPAYPAVTRGMRFLDQYPTSKFTGGSHYLYANYYAIQCMYQTGTAQFNEYYTQIMYSLLDPKRRRSDARGKYWSIKEGDTYSTAMAILILGVPYRFLPIYQR